MIESFGEPFEEAGREESVAEPTSTEKRGSVRERQLEVEVARLEAEIADLKGVGSVEATSRFLAMAAGTIGVAMDEARQEADKARSEAAELTSAALAEVVEIRAKAESEAMALVDAERVRVADEIEALQEVRSALESQRHELEDYHAELRRRVQELAESMVAFMTTETPMDAMPAVDSPTAPELAPATATERPFAAAAEQDFAGVPVLEMPPEAGASGAWPGGTSAPSSVEEMVEEQRFRDFIGGDDHDDKSRDWLLRHDKT